MLASANSISLGLTVLGGISLLVGAVFAALGARARTVANQQDLTINALQGRLAVVESENRQLTSANAGLQSQVTTLNQMFASAKSIEELTVESRTAHAAILAKLE